MKKRVRETVHDGLVRRQEVKRTNLLSEQHKGRTHANKNLRRSSSFRVDRCMRAGPG